MDQGSRVPAPGATRLAVEDLVDPDWYIAQYPDVTTADPFHHYVTQGWRQGRDPGPLFDTDWFLAAYPAARSVDRNPLEYFLEWGSRLVLRPHPLFDPQWYAATYPQAYGWDPFTHYVMAGRRSGLSPSPVLPEIARRRDDVAVSPSSRVVVALHAGKDFVHADRCLRALTGVRGWERTVVTIDAEPDDRWRRWELHPQVTVVRDGDPVDRPEQVDRHIPAGTDYVLLLRPDTEPQPGLISRLIQQHRDAAASAPGTLAICPQSRPTLVAPGLRSDWWRLTELELPPQAALVASPTWRVMVERPRDSPASRGSDLLRLSLAAARTVVSDEGPSILSHLPMTLARRTREAIPSWEPADTPGLVLLTAAADDPVAMAAMLAWLQVAACDVPAAIESLRRWRRQLSELTPQAAAALPRLVRRRHQLVDEIIQECLLDPAVTAAAARAIAEADRDAALILLGAHPDSYPAAVAVVALGPRSRQAPSPKRGIPRVIVQGWFDSPLPVDAAALSGTWSDGHPGWIHLIFDTESAAGWIRDHLGPAAASTFRAAPPVGKSNLFRYAYLSVAGGVWADIDDRCRRDVTQLLAGESLVVATESTGAVADNFIAAVPGHPVLVATRDEAFRNVADGFAESPWLANGPGLFTRKVAAAIADLSAGGASGYRLIAGREMSEYVAMHEHVAYKETELAWDVPPAPVEEELGWGRALSVRQRRVQSGAGTHGSGMGSIAGKPQSTDPRRGERHCADGLARNVREGRADPLLSGDSAARTPHSDAQQPAGSVDRG